MTDEYPEPEVEVPSMAPEALYGKLREGERLTLLDLRDRDEFEEWHIDGPNADVVQIPYIEFVQAEVTDSVAEFADESGLTEPIVAVCARGEASAYVAGLLREEGIDATNLADGMNGWARVSVSTDLDATVAVRQYLRPSSGCLSYLVHAGDEAVVVDPLCAFADRYAEDAADLGVTITHAADTHVHADHLSGIRAVADLTGAEPVLPAGARARGLAFDAALLDDGDPIPVGDARIEAIHVPGHTTEMTALHVGDVLLSGDSLFLESVARPDLEAGDEGAPELARRLHDSLHDRILALPDGTTVAPGHIGPAVEPNADGAYVATLGELRDRLSLLGLDRDGFVERILADMPPRPANFGEIIEVNLGRRDVGAKEAFELELGPNNCAVSA